MKIETFITTTITAAAGLFLALPIASAQRGGGERERTSDRRAAPIPLPSARPVARRPAAGRDNPAPEWPAFEFPREFRRIDGYGNNEIVDEVRNFLFRTPTPRARPTGRRR